MINKYTNVLALPEHQELCKAIIAIVETLYKRCDQNAGASYIRYASLEEAAKMIENLGIDWKENMREKFYVELKNEGKSEGKREVALEMLHEGFLPEVIGEIRKLASVEIEKLQAQRV